MRVLVITPASISDSVPSPNISVCRPRSFLVISCLTTASGMPPMPICRVLPSGIRAATCSAIATWVGPITDGANSIMGAVPSTTWVT